MKYFIRQLKIIKIILKSIFPFAKAWILSFKPHSHCADVATVHPDAGQLVYRDAPGHTS